jgi:hypothetical protein
MAPSIAGSIRREMGSSEHESWYYEVGEFPVGVGEEGGDAVVGVHPL